MKNTLEYKILKHLSDNNNGRFIDISDLESDTNYLKSVITDLKNRELILTQPYPGIPWDSSKGIIGISPSPKPEKCKIKLSGIEYLESLKPAPIPKYQKIYLPLFIFFGLSTMIFAYLNYGAQNKNEGLNSKIDFLSKENLIYKDSIKLLKSKIEFNERKAITDSLQIPNAMILKKNEAKPKTFANNE